MAKAAVSPRPIRGALAGPWLHACAALGLGLLWTGGADGAEGYSILDSFQIEELPRPAEEPESWKQFFEERTVLGVGFDESINDNVFLQDNNKQEDFISTLESQILFADPRGSTLYGVSYEANAYRYHRQDENAIDHDVRAFFERDTGGRLELNSNYKLLKTNSLLLGPEKIDILRRNSGFQSQAEHTWDANLRYALNETNALVPQVEYVLLDDQAIDDSNSDRRTFRAIVDMDHDLRREWILYAGYEFRDVTIPDNELKDSENNGLRLGVRREVSKTDNLDLLLVFEHRRWKTDQQRNTFSFFGKWTRALGPRTQVTLTYEDERIPSYSATRLQFRSTRPGVALTYELSPLTQLSLGANYEKQRSGGKDVLLGNPPTTTVSRRFGLNAGLLWKFREKSHFTLEYVFNRSKSSDYTNHVWTFGVETEI